MLKKDYTELDARTLDLLLVLQAEHGGGNNSTLRICKLKELARMRKTLLNGC